MSVKAYLIEQQFDAASFDVVTSLDAFNCHRSPNEDLAEIHRLLKPGGIFAIEIPGQSYRMLTGSGLLCRLLFGCSLRLNAGVNFYFYTTQSLVTMARRAGFQLQDSYPESTPVQGRWVARMAKTAWFRATSLLYRGHGRPRALCSQRVSDIPQAGGTGRHNHGIAASPCCHSLTGRIATGRLIAQPWRRPLS